MKLHHDYIFFTKSHKNNPIKAIVVAELAMDFRCFVIS